MSVVGAGAGAGTETDFWAVDDGSGDRRGFGVWMAGGERGFVEVRGGERNDGC